MRVFAISDIHGYDERFRALLKSIKLKKSDKVFLLGDYIDRGENSKEVLDTIFLLLENGFDISCIRGNHEQMLLDGMSDSFMRISWIKNGGSDTLKSFLTSDINRIPEKYISFINQLPYYIEYQNFIMVHAGIDMTIESPLSDIKSILWLREGYEKINLDWLNNRTVIHGHTPMKISALKREANLNGNLVCIDNGIYLNGKKEFGGLCAYELGSKEITIL